MNGGRLTYNQVAAPDLSASARILAASGEAFNKGMDSAQGLLGKYQEGQQATADNLMIGEISKLRNEQELDTWLSKNPMEGRNISGDLRKAVMDLRSGVLGYGKDRAGIANTEASTKDTLGRLGIAQNQEGRNSADWTYGNNARDERNSFTPLTVAAANEGLKNGTRGAAPNNPVFSGFMSTIQKEGGVNNPYALAAIAATGSHESAFAQGNLNRVWDDPSESGRPGRAGGVMSWNNDRLQNMQRFTGGDSSPEAQARFFLSEDPALIQKLNNAKSVEEATTLMNNAWRFAGYDRPGGEAEARLNTARGLVSQFDPNGSGGRAAPVTQNEVGGPAYNTLSQALAGSLYTDPDAATGLINTALAAQRTGQTQIDDANTRAAAERSAAATLAAVNSPEVLNPAEAANFGNRNNTGITAVEQLNQTLAVAAGSTALEDIVNGGPTATGVSPEINTAVEMASSNLTDSLQRDTFMRAFTGAEGYRESGDPAQSLVDDLVGMGITSAVPAKVRGRIEELARELNISPEEAAFAFKMAAESRANHNPIWGADSLLTVFGDGLDQAGARKIAAEVFTKDNTKVARRRYADAENKQAELTSLKNAADNAARRLQKAVQNGTVTSSIEREAEEARTKLLEAVASASASSNYKPTSTGSNNTTTVSETINNAAMQGAGMQNRNPQAGWLDQMTR